ncbi:hypothetical protein GOBAR_AA05209 [Gossypium barbadense]|uniref:Uncharacterized protein n=2 Tax=Gossypium TaxID=3633 RepID=A0ABR0Q6K2_GOSAR|nr:hypothetical protein PVK06_010486 [Gossypium arboreum]PPS15381.1 hypothetical protein GOBAR_AA05209 [Gossypium barbadense]
MIKSVEGNEIRGKQSYDVKVFWAIWIWRRGISTAAGVGGVYGGSSIDVAAVTSSAIDASLLSRRNHGGSHVLGLFSGGGRR